MEPQTGEASLADMNPFFSAAGIRPLDMETDWERIVELSFITYGQVAQHDTIPEFREKSLEPLLERPFFEGYVAEIDGQVHGAYLFGRVGDDPMWYMDGEKNPETASALQPHFDHHGLQYPQKDDLFELVTVSSGANGFTPSLLTAKVIEHAERLGVGVVTACWLGDHPGLADINGALGFVPVCTIPGWYSNDDDMGIMVKPRDTILGDNVYVQTPGQDTAQP